MKATIVSSLVIITFYATNLFGFAGPITIDMSNELPDGYSYATVTIEKLDSYCSPGSLDGVKITVDPNEDILIPGTNFGIQKFGFNYDGDAEELTIDVLNDPDGKWHVDLNQNMDGFGVFLYTTSGTGNSRMNPLEVEICNAVDLRELDFIAENENGYAFVAHIADFTFEEEPGYDYTESAFFTTLEPTLVDLINFEATPERGRVVLSWSTESEVENAGFNLYRAVLEDGTYTKINEDLIPAEGTPVYGAYYSFIDEGVQNRKTYWYMLENIDTDGVSGMHGPVSAVPRLMYGLGE